MNTKQIWQALTCNTKTEPYFDGVFSIDMLHKIKNKPKLIICNTDPSTKPGKHWVLFFFHNDTVDFFDSLGNDMNYYGNEFINFAKRFSSKYQISLIQTQPKNTSICGQYCLYFAHKICNGEKMENIIKCMKSPEHVLHFVNRNFVKLVNEHFFKLVQDADICKGVDWDVLPTQLSPQ